MRQDKDRSSKWLIANHGDAILKLAGITGFTSWRTVQPETVAPRRLPDGLLEVRFPGDRHPVFVLIEIESYASADADRQIFEDVALVFLERGRVPEVVLLVLKPKGQAVVSGTIQHASVRNTTRIGGSWPVVQLWDLTADQLFADGDAGLMPWVPLTQSTLPPEELLGRCIERIAGVPSEVERAGLLAVTSILAGFAFPDRGILQLFGGPEAMIESPVLEELKEFAKKRAEAEVSARVEAEVSARVRAETKVRTQRELLREVIQARFKVSVGEKLEGVTDIGRLNALVPLAATCPTLEAFVAELNK